MPRITLTVPGHSPQPYRFDLYREVVTFGRADDNDIIVQSGSVSSYHAGMHRVEGGYELQDSDSTNGISLDGVRRETIALRPGANVMLGDVLFEFELSDEEIQSLDAERKPKLPELPAGVGPVEPGGPPATPAASAPALVIPETRRAPRRSKIGAGAILMILILAVAAFFAGISIRYTKETGRAWLPDVKAKWSGAEAAKAAPAASTPVEATEQTEPTERETSEDDPFAPQ